MRENEIAGVAATRLSLRLNEIHAGAFLDRVALIVREGHGAIFGVVSALPVGWR